MAPRIVLVGMPGVGKSTVGRALAAQLGLPFADTDDLVLAATGRTAAEWVADCEPAFRAEEAAAVNRALSGFDGVLALGGGALVTSGVRAALTAAGVPVVHLQADIATLLGRIGASDTRPLLAGDVRQRLVSLAAQRRDLYAHYPGVATDNLDVQAVVRRLVDHLAVYR